MPMSECYRNDPHATTLADLRSLYVHVPFCHTICGYCDFYSEVYDKKAVGALVDALLAELARCAETAELQFDTIFVGGGTPTTLPVPLLSRLMSTLRGFCVPDATIEFTSEANPATVTPQVAEALVASGVNRISIGAQSFNKSELAVLERIHDPRQVVETIQNARAAGIENINVDLIFAVPGQTLASWRDNLRNAIDLGTRHLSCYGLTFESGTPLFDQRARGEIQQVDDGLEADMYEATIADLAAAGFAQYEISNFARPGYECRHNLRYWTNAPYLAIGPSACGFVDNVRYKNVPDTAAYVSAVRRGKSPRIEEETLDLADQARDAAWLELRLLRGIDRTSFAQRYGEDPSVRFATAIQKNLVAGLIEMDEASIRLTRSGLLLANRVMADILA
ncbi:MAG: radical SAM family heme chaperone HemW [Phycisphaerae bacterium]